MARRRNLVAAGVVAALAATGLVACDPPPPRLLLTVTSTASGADDIPGDGACASAAAGGACTLQAAFEEGDASASGADLIVPAGTHSGLDVSITGNVRVNPGAPATVALKASTLTVSDGGHLDLTGVNTSRSQGDVAHLDLVVEGGASLSTTRSVLDTLTVGAGGGAVLDTTLVFTTLSSAVTNAGTVLAASSSILVNTLSGPAVAQLSTTAGGATHLKASVVAQPAARYGSILLAPGGGGRCSGVPPISGGHVVIEVPCGSTPAPGDGSGPADTAVEITVSPTSTVTGVRHVLDAGSPLIDAIPLGDPACDATSVDLYGAPRGVDGDGDGVGGCDIGAIERQP